MTDKQKLEPFVLVDDDDDALPEHRETGMRLEIASDPKGINLLSLWFDHSGYTSEMNMDRPQVEALRNWLETALHIGTSNNDLSEQGK